MHHAVTISKIKTKSQELLFRGTVSHQIKHTAGCKLVSIVLQIRVLLLHPSVLYFRQYLTQQWTHPGAAASASTLCCVTLPPRQLDFFPCRHPSFTASIRLITQHKARVIRAINSPLLGRSLLCDAHHRPDTKVSHIWSLLPGVSRLLSAECLPNHWGSHLDPLMSNAG